MKEGDLFPFLHTIYIITDMFLNNDFCRVNQTLKIGIFNVIITLNVQVLFEFIYCNFHICITL